MKRTSIPHGMEDGEEGHPALPKKHTEPGVFTNLHVHLHAELDRIDWLLHSQVSSTRAVYQKDQHLQGLYISEEEVDTVLQQPRKFPPWRREQGLTADVTIQEEFVRRRDAIDDMLQVSTNQNGSFPLSRLREIFGLSPLEIDILLVCLLPELDSRYERLYAYLQDDLTKKRPTVDFVLNLLCASFDEKIRARELFGAGGLLRTQQLISLVEDSSYSSPTFMSQYLKLDERIVGYLLGSDQLDERISSFAQYRTPTVAWKDLYFPKEFKDNLEGLGKTILPNQGSFIFYFQGPSGVGKQSTAEAMCGEIGMRLFVVDGERFLAIEGINHVEATLRRIMRESLLQGAALYWTGFDALLVDDKKSHRHALLQILEHHRGLTFLEGETTWVPSDVLHSVPFVRIEFPQPSFTAQKELWRHALAQHAPHTQEGLLDVLTTKFRFTGGQIQDAVITAKNLARSRGTERPDVTFDDLSTACRLQSNGKLGALAQKIIPHYHWDDIILPAGHVQQLREICNYLKHRSLVYDEWGFDRKLAMGKGLNVLFAGPSGTGKTMAADIIANELDLELYKIDLSMVVSKYIGETEKNLSKIFAEAESSNAILFFDEADALFGKRSDVQSSHDRYANIETSYLLQKMEEYQGVVILATNYRKNMDEAFVRRIHITIEFPFPGEAERRRIWDRMWPSSLPLEKGLDFDFLAQRYEMTGGNIRNVALAAAFMAADNGNVVGMEHLLRAMRREYQKMGKIVNDGEFQQRQTTATFLE